MLHEMILNCIFSCSPLTDGVVEILSTFVCTRHPWTHVRPRRSEGGLERDTLFWLCKVAPRWPVLPAAGASVLVMLFLKKKRERKKKGKGSRQARGGVWAECRMSTKVGRRSGRDDSFSGVCVCAWMLYTWSLIPAAPSVQMDSSLYREISSFLSGVDLSVSLELFLLLAVGFTLLKWARLRLFAVSLIHNTWSR